MPSVRSYTQQIGVARLAACLALIVILLGVLVRFVPHLFEERTLSAGVPAPPALSAPSMFSLAPGQSACMSLVAVEPASRVATFSLLPAGASSKAPSQHLQRLPRPAVELTLTASGFQASARTAAGYGAKSVSVRIDPPRHALLSTACFVDRGTIPVLLEGSSEARTITRSATVVNGTSVVGDIALSFAAAPRRSLLDSLGDVFGRASALTEGLVPVGLIWALALLVALVVPLGVVAALYLAVREDDLTL